MFSVFRGNSQKKDLPTKTKANNQQVKSSGAPRGVIYNTDLKLRDNFADELLNLECEIESPSITLDQVIKLLELYREAVEYFEATQSNKYLIFKNKMQTLLTKKNVIQVMKVQVPSKQQQQSDSEPKTQTQKELIIRLNYLRGGTDQANQVENFLQEHIENECKINDFINTEIVVQQKAIQQRLQQRRNSSIKRDNGQVFVMNQADIKPQKQDDLYQMNLQHTPKIRGSAQLQYFRNQQNDQNSQQDNYGK